MTGYCVSDDHAECPDSSVDTFACSCPCHAQGRPVETVRENIAAINDLDVLDQLLAEAWRTNAQGDMEAITRRITEITHGREVR